MTTIQGQPATSTRRVRRALLALLLLALLAPSHLRAGVIGQWSFEADFTDSSGHGHHLSLPAGSVVITPGRIGNGARFDGSGFLYSTAAALVASHTQFSLGTWFQATGNPGPDAVLLGNFYDGGAVYRAGLTDHFGAVYGYVQDGANHANSPALPSANDAAWHHVVETFDGTTIRLYVDGALVDTTASAFGSTGSVQEFSVGGRSVADNLFTGIIDEAFFRDDVLSSSEVASLFEAGTLMVPEPPTLVLSGMAVLIGCIRMRRR